LLSVANTMANSSPGSPGDFSEGRWAVQAVLAVQAGLAPFDDFLSFVSSASNPASVLHFLVPILALFDQTLALQVVVSYVIADISNLAMKWPLQGDRPYWMDPAVRQFGHNTCEVGFGMPSGHVQVTVAVYALLVVAIRKRWFGALVAGVVGLTALSRVHMGAHTPLQVSCGALAGAAIAFLVTRLSPVIKPWAAREFGSMARVGWAVVAVAAATCVIAVECEALTASGIDIYASVGKATAACVEGVGKSVSSARGVARDCGALVGAAVGRSLALVLRPKHTLVSAAAAMDANRRLDFGWGRALVGAISAWVALQVVNAGADVFQSNGHVLFRRALDAGETEWLSVVSNVVKYTLLLAIGTGLVPAFLASPRSSLLSESDLSVHEREKAAMSGTN